MNKALCLLVCAALTLPAFAKGGKGHHKPKEEKAEETSTAKATPGTTNPQVHEIKGYVRKDGTYVAPSHATSPNATKADNFSTKGNVNPYTGKEGTKSP